MSVETLTRPVEQRHGDSHNGAELCYNGRRKGGSPRKAKWHKAPKQEISGIGLCYFTALCSTLKLIDDKARDRGVWKLEKRSKKVHSPDGTLVGFQDEFTGRVLPEIDTGEKFTNNIHRLGDMYVQDQIEQLERIARLKGQLKSVGVKGVAHAV